MVKKDLTNKPREEMQEFITIDAKVSQETPDEQPIQPETRAIEEVSINAADQSPPNQPSPIEIELKATITELRSTIEKAQKREDSFVQQISDLKAELSEQKKLAKKLQKELEQTNLKSELEQAKKTALELADANSKLIQEMKALQKEKEKEIVKAPEPPKSIQKLQRVPLPPEKTKMPADFAENTWLLD